MRVNLEKIDKCDFCSRKAEYYIQVRKWLIEKNGFLCEFHKNQIMNLIDRKWL